MEQEDQIIWVCQECGEEVLGDRVIAKGYGHTIVIQEGGEYFEAVCGPLEKKATSSEGKS